MDLKVGSNVPEDLHISAQLVCNQSSTHALSLGTVFAVADEYRSIEKTPVSAKIGSGSNDFKFEIKSSK